MESIFPEIIAAFAGFGGGALLHRLTTRNGLDEKAVNLITSDNFDLRQKVNLLERYNAQYSKRIAKLESELAEMTVYNEILKSMPVDWPFPLWMVNMKHEYDHISPMYEEVFLKPFGRSTAECIGKSLDEIWPREIAGQFIENNNKVMQEGVIFNDTEEIATPDGNVEKWQVIKYKRLIPMGLIGIAIPRNGNFDKYLNKIKNK